FLFLSGLFLFSFQRSRSALSRAVLSYITKSTATRQHLFSLFLVFFLLFLPFSFVIGFIDSL
ncbi:hypothetical protein, partial [Faecalicoccus pleomorphus]|uniref:hypothetical protein n=1 Tax=Faecalicoccus pleomorphus TaxID=1323 RepID=UPI001961E706